jgi:hypothetical protein
MGAIMVVDVFLNYAVGLIISYSFRRVRTLTSRKFIVKKISKKKKTQTIQIVMKFPRGI